MNKIIKVSLGLFLVSTLVACNSNDDNKQSENVVTETPVSAETTNEPELKEIEITLDNWQDYYDFYTELTTEKAEGTRFSEEDQGKEYHNAYELCLRIKDEYKEKIDPNKKSMVPVAADIESVIVKASIVDGNLIMEEELFSEDNPAWEDHGYAFTAKAEIENDEVIKSWGYRIDESGIIVHDLHLSKEALNMNDIINGTSVKGLGVFHDNVKDANGISYTTISDDTVFAVVKERKMNWRGFQGKIYFWE